MLKLNLKRKLIGLFILIGLTPFLLIGLYTYHRAGASIEQAAFNHLITVRDQRKAQIEKLFHDIDRDLTTIAKSEDVHRFVHDLTVYHEQVGALDEGPFPVDTETYQHLLTQAHTAFLRYYIQSYGFHDMLIICKAHGHVMYSVARDADLGTNLSAGPYRDSALATLWRRVVETRRPSAQDFTPYAPLNGQPACFVGVPILTHDSQLIGVLAVQLDIATINTIMQQRTGLGESGETYLVGPDQLMRSDSALDSRRRAVAASFANPEIGRVDTHAAQLALDGHTGTLTDKDYRQVVVLSAYTPVDFSGVRWALLAEIDRHEAFATKQHLWRAIWLVGLVIGVIVILIGIGFARALSRPLQAGSQQLNATSAEILAAIQQQAGSMREQAAAVQETSSTMDEIRETGAQVSERAQAVTRAAEDASATSQTGIQAVTETHTIMESIRAQVEEAAQHIVALSEKTLAIGAIIATVNDIAEQSNLLAINAAIEAAGAGEHGRRFAVVAEEIKNLADQAKAATVEVRGMLSEIQSGISTSVMSTEEAVKRVADGRAKSEIASATIQQLTEAVSQSIQAFQQIVAGANQQQIGLDQVNQALKDIDQGASQTAAGIGQIETAVSDLNALSSQLNDMVDRR